MGGMLQRFISGVREPLPRKRQHFGCELQSNRLRAVGAAGINHQDFCAKRERLQTTLQVLFFVLGQNDRGDRKWPHQLRKTTLDCDVRRISGEREWGWYKLDWKLEACEGGRKTQSLLPLERMSYLLLGDGEVPAISDIQIRNRIRSLQKVLQNQIGDEARVELQREDVRGPLGDTATGIRIFLYDSPK